MEDTNFNEVKEIIGSAVFELDEEAFEESLNLVNRFMDLVEESYILVQWPESQEYMEEDWFDEEAIFCGGSEDKTGSSAYFIPIKYVV